jgi:hypothetical protein
MAKGCDKLRFLVIDADFYDILFRIWSKNNFVWEGYSTFPSDPSA